MMLRKPLQPGGRKHKSQESTQTTKKVHKRKKSTQTTKANTQTTTASTQKNTKNRGKYRIEKSKILMFFLRVFVAKKLWEIMALPCHVTEKNVPD